jgi:chemotaxis protein CheD
MASRAIEAELVDRNQQGARANAKASSCRPVGDAGRRASTESGRVPRGKTYVRPGDVLVSVRPDVLFTVLGSCVSVCLWDPQSRIAGMNHFVFPGRPADFNQRGPRFGADAVNRLVERVQGAGADLSRTVAKVFGGARIPEVRAGKGSISDENVLVATQLLRQRGIRIVASDLGGHLGRKVLFDTSTGDVWMKYLVGSGDD